MTKSEINAAIASYALWLNSPKEAENRLDKQELLTLTSSLRVSMAMVDALPDEVDSHILDVALANLLAFVVSNGKSTYAESVNHLSMVVKYTDIILELSPKTPIARVMDYIMGKEQSLLVKLVQRRKKRKLRKQ